MPPDYSMLQLLSDMMAVIRDAAVYLVPSAIILGAVAFCIAWFNDAIDLAGKVFGRHR